MPRPTEIMIVPGYRLMLLLAALLPFSILGALFAPLRTLAVLVFIAFGLLALADAVLGCLRLKDIALASPDVVRLSKDRAGVVPLFVDNRGRRVSRIQVAPRLPAHFESTHETLTVDLPPSPGRSQAAWPCTPTTRGSYLLPSWHFQVDSPGALWALRARSAVPTEVRVYPNLVSERRQLAALFLNRGHFGIHAQRRVGQGREFEKLRDYIPGDSFEDIHWKATAKRGSPVTKLYQIERTQEIYVLIDTSRLSARDLGAGPALERYIAAALVLGLVAEQQGDRFGLLTFDDRIRRFVRASGGRAHFSACRDALYTLMPRLATPDFDELAAFVRLRLRRRALLLVLTDLADPVLAESFIHSAAMMRRQHLVMVTSIRRPGVEEIFTTPGVESTGAIYDRLAGHMAWRRLQELDRGLHRAGIGFTVADHARLSAELVNRYMNIKARQAL